MKNSLVSLLILSFLALALPAPASAGAQAAAPIRTVTQLPGGLLVSWQAPDMQAAALPDGTYELRMEGFASAQTPGEARLPVDTALVAIPPGANPTAAIQTGPVEAQPLPGPVGIAPGAVSVPGEDGERVFDLSQPAQTPAETVTFEEIGVMRGVRLARLTFSPVRIEGGSALVTRQVSVTVNFGASAPASSALDAGPAANDAVLSALAHRVVNPAQLGISPEARQFSPALVDRAGQAAIEVSTTGLTAVSQEALAAAGFAVDAVDPHSLHIERAGVDIPVEWVGNDNAAFEAGEQLLFYAAPRFSRWTARDVYFLSAGSAPRHQMTTRPVSAAGLTAANLWVDQLFEENTIYTPDCYCAPIPAGRDGDRWVWSRLYRPANASASFTAQLAAVDQTQPARVAIWLIGYTNVAGTEHTVSVELNGTDLGSLTFSGKQVNPEEQSELSIPAGVLAAGENTLTLTLEDGGTDVDGVWLDAFSIRYARDLSAAAGQLAASGAEQARSYSVTLASTAGMRAYDVTAADQPVRLTGASADATHALLTDPSSGLPRRYAVVPSGSLLAPDAVRMATPLSGASGADYIMISPAEFGADLEPLAEVHRQDGLEVVIEDVQAVYDAYDGRPLPEAIQAYLQQAYAQWSPRPAYALLAGDGTTDPRQYRASSTRTFIPPFLVDGDPVIGEVPSDSRYAMVDGDDSLPDLAIGRLPANSYVEAAIMVGKIVRYESFPPAGTWSRRMLLVSDEDDPSAGYFAAENQALAANYAASRYQVDQMQPPDWPSQAAYRQAIIEGWNASSGILLYNGHASTHQWGAGSLFHINDLPSLVNGDRLPVLLEMTCLTASFQIPTAPTLDETLLRRSGKGAAAVWGSTGLSLSSGSMMLAENFLDLVVQAPETKLGAAANQAKVELYASAPGLAYLIDIYTLLGDPAMTVNYRFDAYIPAVQKVKP